MNLQDFIAKYKGKADVGNTDANRGECVGLVSVWMDTLNIPHLWGHAKDLLANANNDDYKHYLDVIKNAPDNHPVPGDIICWDKSWGGGYGHTGVVITADVNKFTCFEQNNPTGSTPHIVSHANYTGVQGWLHPKNLQADLQKTIDDLRLERDTNWNLHLQDQERISELEKSLKDEQIKSQNLREALDIQTKADADTGVQLLDAQHKVNEYNQLLKELNATDLSTAKEALDTLRKPIEEQVKPLEKHALSLQEVLDGFIYKRVPQSKPLITKIIDKIMWWLR